MSNYLGYDRTSTPQLFVVASDVSGITQNYGVQHTGQGIFFYYDISNNAQPVAFTPNGFYIPSPIPSIPIYSLDASNNTTYTTYLGGGIGVSKTGENTTSLITNSVLQTNDINDTNYAKLFSSGSASFHNTDVDSNIFDVNIGANNAGVGEISMTTQLLGGPSNTWFVADGGTTSLNLGDTKGFTTSGSIITTEYIANYNLQTDAYSYIGYAPLGNVTGFQVQEGVGGANYTAMDFNGVSCVDNTNNIYSSSLTQTSLSINDSSKGGLVAKIADPTGMTIDNISGDLTIDGANLSIGWGGLVNTSVNITSFTWSNMLIGAVYRFNIYNLSSGNIRIYAKSSANNTNFSWGNGTNTSYDTLQSGHTYLISVIYTGIGGIYYDCVGTILQPHT